MNVRTFAWISPLVLLWACFGSPYKAHFEEMAGPAEAHWRGVKLGETWEKVQELEDAKALMALDSAFAKYHFHYSDSEYYEVQYQFVEGRLDEIYVQVFLESELRAEELTELAVAHFEAAWNQEALMDQGVFAMSKPDAVLEIMDESPFHGPGMIRLIFRAPPGNKSNPEPQLPS
ncbi:MAG: hypothetical protein ACO3AF_01530 [Flavobacteriales bacterium]|jgi:hypothetical protein